MRIKSKKADKSPNVFISDTELLCAVIFGIIFMIITLILFHERKSNMTWWLEILISMAASSVASVGVSIFIYFKFLKKIPDETEKKIDKLLNARLGYETTNHNSIIEKIDRDLNPKNSTLFSQHNQIFERVQKVHDMVLEEKAIKKLALSNMTDEQKKISSSVDNLQNLSKVIESLVNENKQLKEDVIELRQLNEQKQAQIAKLQKNHKRRTHDYDYEQELSL